MRSVETTGKTLEDAIQAALDQLSARREDVEIEVLDEGSKGLFGLLGAKLARVRVTLTHSLESKAERAVEFLSGLLSHMGVDARVESRMGEDNLVYLDIHGRRLGSVIGRRGQTLDAIQYLTNLVANRERGPRARIVIDAEGYRQKRAETLENLALRLAEKAKASKQRTALEPMSALERRVVHLALADDDEVETHSEGDEPYRRVVIVPKRA